MEVFGQYVSLSKMKFELSRTQNGHHVNDAQLSLLYDDEERLLHGKAYMRPTLWNDVHAKMREGNFVPSWLLSDFSQLQRSLSYDMQLKRHYLRQSIEEPVKSVANYYVRELSRKWQQVSYSVHRMYDANEFYMRDIHQALKQHYDDFRFILSQCYVLYK